MIGPRRRDAGCGILEWSCDERKNRRSHQYTLLVINFILLSPVTARLSVICYLQLEPELGE